MTEEFEESENKGSFLLALGVGVGLTLLIETAFTFGLDPTTSLIARYMSVMAGVIITAVVAFLGRGLLKSAFAGFLVLLSSAILPFLFGFASLYGILTPLIPTLTETINLIKVLAANTDAGVDPAQLDSLTPLLQYAVVVDLFFGLLISTFAGLGMVLVLKIFKKNSGIMSIVGFVIGLIFLLIGALILPYMFVGISGAGQFGLGMANGSLELSQGLQLTQNNFTSENAALASPYFDRANEWFEQSKKMLEEVRALGMFWMVSLAFPQYANVIDQGSIILEAGTDVVQAIGPFVAAGAYLNEGFNLAGSSFNPSTSALSVLSADDDFNRGIELIELAFDNITKATTHIQAALTKLSQITAEEMKQSLVEAGLQGNDQQIQLVFDAAEMLNSTMDVLKVLINPLNDSPKAPLIHLLYGLRALASAGDFIGDQSNFAGTGSFFDDMKGNLTIINDAMNTPTLITFRNKDSTEYVDQIASIHANMAGAFNFFDDTADIAIGFADFGKAIVPILQSMNSTMAILNQDNLDLLSIDDSTFDEAITNLETMRTNSVALVVTAQGIQEDVDTMAQKSKTEEYGLLKDAASEIATQFTSFDLVTNSQNFVYLSSGFSEVFKATKLFKAANITMGYIQTDVQEIVDAPDDTAKVTALNNNAARIDANLTEVDNLLGNASVNIVNAQSNFSKAINDGGMTQLGNIDTVLASINTHISNIRGAQGIQKIQAIMADPVQAVSDAGGDVNVVIGNLTTALDYIIVEMEAITTELSTLSISA